MDDFVVVAWNIRFVTSSGGPAGGSGAPVREITDAIQYPIREIQRRKSACIPASWLHRLCCMARERRCSSRLSIPRHPRAGSLRRSGGCCASGEAVEPSLLRSALTALFQNQIRIREVIFCSDKALFKAFRVLPVVW